MARGIQDHPDFDQIFGRITAILSRAISFHQLVFRSSEPTYATENDLLNGEGSRKNGGRWNPPVSFSTVYASYSDTSALAEVKAAFRYYGLDPADALPRTIVAIDVRFARVLDLTNGAIRKSIGVSATRMRNDDWRAENRRGNEALAQTIGRAAYESGLEAIIVPSSLGTNLVWFPGNLRGTSKATIRNPDQLGQ
jgi:RES domain-containing protein